MTDTLDIVSLAEAKTILKVGSLNTTEDANLSRLVTTVSRRLDKLVGPIVRRTITDERHNGGSCLIELDGPVFSFTTVTEYDSAGAPTVLTEETHTTKPAKAWLGERYVPDSTLYSGMIVRRASGSDTFFPWGRNNVLVTYMSGRYATTATVDQRFKEAAGLCLKNLWRSYQESVGQVGEFDVPMQFFPTFAVPKAVMDMLHPEVQPEVGFGA